MPASQPSTGSGVGYISSKDHIIVARLAVILHLIEYSISKLGDDGNRTRTRSQRQVNAPQSNTVELRSVTGAQKILNNCRKQGMILLNVSNIYKIICFTSKTL